MPKVNPLSTPATDPTESQTRCRILCAAEELFSRHGYATTTLRMITRKADVNLASVNYHFGSKEKLLLELIRHHIRPINAHRMQLLDEALKPVGKKPELERVLDALFRPAFEYFSGGNHAAAVRLLCLVLYEDHEFDHEVIHEEMMPVFEKFHRALCLALPKAPCELVAVRLHFAVGSMIHFFAVSHMKCFEKEPLFQSSHEEIMRDWIAFNSAGFRAAEKGAR